jgi:hypothetical protein
LHRKERAEEEDSSKIGAGISAAVSCLMHEYEDSFVDHDDTTPWYLREVLEEIQNNNLSVDDACDISIRDDDNTYKGRRTNADTEQDSKSFTDGIDNVEIIFRPYHGPLHFEVEEDSTNSLVSSKSAISVLTVGSLAFTAVTVLGGVYLFYRRKEKGPERKKGSEGQMQQNVNLAAEKNDSKRKRTCNSVEFHHKDETVSTSIAPTVVSRGRIEEDNCKEEISPSLSVGVPGLEDETESHKRQCCHQTISSALKQEPTIDVDTKELQLSVVSKSLSHDSDTLVEYSRGPYESTPTLGAYHYDSDTPIEISGEGVRDLSLCDNVIVSTSTKESMSIQQQEDRLYTPSPISSLSTMSFAKHVHMIASTVSSTGLNREESLKLANEVIIRRLEFQFQTREQETQSQHRSLVKDWERELERLRSMTYQLFPGSLFLTSTSLSLASRAVWKHKGFIFELSHGNGQSFGRIVMHAIDHFCPCSSDVQDVTTTTPTMYSLASQYVLSSLFHSISATASTAGSHVQLFACRSLCIVQVLIPTILLFFAHKLLGALHCREIVHRTLNLFVCGLYFIPGLLCSNKEGDAFSWTSAYSQMTTHVRALFFCHILLAAGLHGFLRRHFDNIEKDRDLHSSIISMANIRKSIKFVSFACSVAIGFFVV